MFSAFVLVFLFLVLSVCSLNNEVALFCVCVVCFLFKQNKWFSGLHLVVLFLFWLFCVQFFVFCFHSFPKKTPQNRHSKNPKKQKCRKTGQRKHSVSAVVFTNSVPNFLGWATKNIILC